MKNTRYCAAAAWVLLAVLFSSSYRFGGVPVGFLFLVTIKLLVVLVPMTGLLWLFGRYLVHRHAKLAKLDGEVLTGPFGSLQVSDIVRVEEARHWITLMTAQGPRVSLGKDTNLVQKLRSSLGSDIPWVRSRPGKRLAVLAVALGIALSPVGAHLEFLATYPVLESALLRPDDAGPRLAVTHLTDPGCPAGLRYNFSNVSFRLPAGDLVSTGSRREGAQTVAFLRDDLEVTIEPVFPDPLAKTTVERQFQYATGQVCADMSDETRLMDLYGARVCDYSPTLGLLELMRLDQGLRQQARVRQDGEPYRFVIGSYVHGFWRRTEPARTCTGSTYAARIFSGRQAYYVEWIARGDAKVFPRDKAELILGSMAVLGD